MSIYIGLMYIYLQRMQNSLDSAFRKTRSQSGTLHHFGRVCMKRTANLGHPKVKQSGILKARYVCYSSDEDESHQAFQLNPTQ